MKKIVFLVLGVALLLVLNLTSVSVSSSGDKTPEIPVWIEATYRITFINMTTMNISSTFAVHKICIDKNNFTADSIRENYTDNPEVGMEIINKTMEEIDNAFNTVINTTFANDTVESEPTTEDKSTIIGVVPGGDEYQPPINFTKNATITFNMTSFGFEENPELKLDDVIRGTLKMGAVINKAFELKADAGYKNTF
ncbi:hypothetical protein FP804_05445, partial [archaeon]|nr:hypothetical protein [archaeon]